MMRYLLPFCMLIAVPVFARPTPGTPPRASPDGGTHRTPALTPFDRCMMLDCKTRPKPPDLRRKP